MKRSCLCNWRILSIFVNFLFNTSTMEIIWWKSASVKKISCRILESTERNRNIGTKWVNSFRYNSEKWPNILYKNLAVWTTLCIKGLIFLVSFCSDNQNALCQISFLILNQFKRIIDFFPPWNWLSENLWFFLMFSRGIEINWFA